MRGEPAKAPACTSVPRVESCSGVAGEGECRRVPRRRRKQEERQGIYFVEANRESGKGLEWECEDSRRSRITKAEMGVRGHGPPGSSSSFGPQKRVSLPRSLLHISHFIPPPQRLGRSHPQVSGHISVASFYCDGCSVAQRRLVSFQPSFRFTSATNRVADLPWQQRGLALRAPRPHPARPPYPLTFRVPTPYEDDVSHPPNQRTVVRVVGGQKGTGYEPLVDTTLDAHPRRRNHPHPWAVLDGVTDAWQGSAAGQWHPGV